MNDDQETDDLINNSGSSDIGEQDVDLSAQLDALLAESESKFDANPELSEHIEKQLRTPDPSVVPNREISPVQPELQAREAAQQKQAPAPPENKIEIDPEVAAIEAPKGMSESNRANWRKLQESSTMWKRQAQEAEVLRQRYEELERQKATPQAPPDYEDLKRFRAVYDIKNDPEFIKKYQEPIEKASRGVYSTLEQANVPQRIIDSIKAAGGPAMVDKKWWEDNLGKFSEFQKQDLVRNLTDAYRLQEEQAQEIEGSTANIQQYEQQQLTKRSEWYNEETKVIDNELAELVKDKPYLHYQQVPENATPAMVEAIQKHNDGLNELKNIFNAARYPKDAQERARVAGAATYVHVLVPQLRIEQQYRTQLQQELKQAKDELAQIRGASRMPRSNISTHSAAQSTSLQDRLKMNSSDAIDAGLDEALRG